MSLALDLRNCSRAREATAEGRDLPHHHYIDCLRGLAFLGVFLFHFRDFLPKDQPLVTDIVDRGYAGVELFYVLSAYTLSISLTHRSEQSGHLLGYGVRRFFRIAPLYWFAIALYCLYFGLGPRWHLGEGVGVADLLLNVIFLHGFDPIALNGVVPGGWSVAVEVQFYLLLPLLLTLCSTPKGLVLTFFGALILSFAGRPLIEANLLGASVVGREAAHEFAYFSLASHLPVFLCGVGLFRITSWRKAMVFPAGPILGVTPRQLSAAIVLAVLTALFPLDITGPSWRLLPGFPGFLGFGLLSALLVYALTLCDNRLINNRITRYFGKISFGCYLFHHLMNQYVISHFPELDVVSALLLSLALTALMASAARGLIEEPGIALGRRLLRTSA